MILPKLLASLLLSALLQTGFAIHDLTQLPTDPASMLGSGFIARSEATRVILMCATCKGSPLIDVRLGRQEDGTEARVRSGATTIAQMEALCRQRDPACRIEALTAEPAVGWMSTYRAGTQFAHTIVVLRDGDLLTIRVLSEDATIARGHADVLVKKLVPQVVGT